MLKTHHCVVEWKKHCGSVVGWLIVYRLGILSLSCSLYSQTICWCGWDDSACLRVRNNSIGAWPNSLDRTTAVILCSIVRWQHRWVQKCAIVCPDSMMHSIFSVTNNPNIYKRYKKFMSPTYPNFRLYFITTSHRATYKKWFSTEPKTTLLPNPHKNHLHAY